MKPNSSLYRSARLLAWLVTAYGASIVLTTLTRELRLHGRYGLHEWLLSVHVLTGMGYVYLGTRLMRLKYNAWLAALLLLIATLIFNGVALALHPAHESSSLFVQRLHIALPLLVLVLLLLSRSMFKVRSDMVGFRQAVRTSAFVVLLALVYGTAGFMLLDQRDFHQEIGLFTAAHQTLDQFGVTTRTVTAYTTRAHVFTDSLTFVSFAALLSVIVAFFQPIRFTLRPQSRQRQMAERLLHKYPSDIDDYFKLWPHDKQYFFGDRQEAGLAFHVTAGVALVVGDPFGNPKQFLLLCQNFQEFCSVNDWRPAFIHVNDTHRALYEKLGMRMQKIGEEAVLSMQDFEARQRDKYFRQIRNRFTKLGYAVELLEPPHAAAVLQACAGISRDWLARPGRAERGFMMAPYSTEYMQQSKLAVVRDAEKKVQGFMNVVPTYEPTTANYDLLRCAASAPGNCNDFLLLETIAALKAQGYTTLNLGLCPLKGLQGDAKTSVIDTALRFIYANGDRFYSFSGLERFKAKYHPTWEGRYVAYAGGPTQFARVMTALTRAMKIK